MSKTLLIIFVSLFVLVGCGTRTVYEEKKVPIYMVPAPPTIPRPDLPIHDVLDEVTLVSATGIVSEKDFGRVARAYVVSLRLAMNWGTALDQIVETYRKMSERDFSVKPISFSTSRVAASPMAEDESIEMNQSDFGTIKMYADREFSEIINKYHQDEQTIREEYNNAPEPD